MPPHPRALVFSTFLLVTSPKLFAQEDSIRYKFQYYDEDDGRVDVESHYVDLRKTLPYELTLGVRYATNILTGATPTGLLEEGNHSRIQLQELEDRRDVVTLDINKSLGDHSFTFEYTRSEEDDYISNGYALRMESEFFNKQTTLTLGVAYNDDSVTAVPLFGDRDKETLDFGIGLSQILGKNTLLELNATLGYSRGYLGDPYKSIQREETVLIPNVPPIVVDVPYFENRPDERLRVAFRAQILHYFEAPDAGIEASYRYFHDDAGINAHTFKLAWNQNVGEHLVISPYFRYYRQSAADYYHVTLDGTNIDPNDDRTGDSPYYSADYRVSRLEAITLGLKLIYMPNTHWNFDIGVEHYEMFGKDSVTPDAAYPKALIYNIGGSYRF